MTPSRKSLTLAFAALLSPLAYAQEVSNVVAFQENGKVVVKYDLLSLDPAREFFVKLYSSTDGGKSFGGALVQVSGDVNKIVKAGVNHVAVWDLLKEATVAKGEFTFRIDAMSIGVNGALPTVNEKDVSVQFLDIARTDNNVAITISVTNKGAQAFPLILDNFLIVDDKDKMCRDHSGDINKFFSVPPGGKQLVNFVIKGISPAAKAFSQLDFNAGTLVIRLKDLPIPGN